MRRPTSLTLRLTLLFGAVITVGFLTLGWIIERSLNEHFGAEDIKELKVIAQAVERTLSTLQYNQNPELAKQRFDDILVGHHGPLLYIRDASGKQFYRSPESDISLLASPDQLLQSGIHLWNDSNQNYRVLVQQVTASSNDPYTIIIAVDIDFHLHFLHSFRRTLWLMVAGGIAIMGLLGWLAVRHGHRPLHSVVDQIHKISANELNTRLDPKAVPAELTELAKSFNELLQRLEEAFIRLSNFSADIAHELRTPVTNLMTQTQVALSQVRDSEEYQEILYSNIEEYERMAQMIGDMLFLAKADDDLDSPNAENIDLENEVRNLFDYYEAWAEENRISLILEGRASVQGDALMLRRALSNLLSNAIHHTPQGESISIKLSCTEDSVLIIVQNPGTPIPTEHLSKIFDRFYRIDPSRQRGAEGAGLGLAIVKSIVEIHNGEISVTSDKTYTQFQIRLPLKGSVRNL